MQVPASVSARPSLLAKATCLSHDCGDAQAQVAAALLDRDGVCSAGEGGQGRREFRGRACRPLQRRGLHGGTRAKRRRLERMGSQREACMAAGAHRRWSGRAARQAPAPEANGEGQRVLSSAACVGASKPPPGIDGHEARQHQPAPLEPQPTCTRPSVKEVGWPLSAAKPSQVPACTSPVGVMDKAG